MTSFRVLGPVEAWTDERRLALGGPQQVKLLAFLLLNANRAVSADAVIDAVWGSRGDRTAKRLQMGVLRLRRALAPLDGEDRPRVRTVGHGYVLAVRSGELDADAFSERVRDGRRALEAGHPVRASELLAEALNLWRGPPFADVAFDEFAQGEIRRLEELRLGTLETRINTDLELHRHSELIPELEELLAEQPTRERVAGQLMTALYRSGRQGDALEVYQRTRTRLATDLGLEPGPALKALQTQILEQAVTLNPPGLDGLPAGRRSPRPPRAATPPLPPTAMIGREADLGLLRTMLLAEDTRLLTLVGPGGVGKTRLALAVSHSVESDFRDGVFWVELAATGHSADVATTIARSLEITMEAGETADQALRRHLDGRRVLLALDNLEHVLQASSLIASLLSACAGPVVIATSREALNIAAEQRYPVDPLELPTRPEQATVDQIEAAAATAMFLDAARRREARFTVNPDSAPKVARLCARLDGLPLALELAAARVGFLGLSELTDSLDTERADPALAPRDTPDRQKTLHATVDWSYRLLEESEQRCFARFALFVGGASLQAAQAVTAARAETLHSLIAKSLLARREQADGRSRLVMLQTVRNYALDRFAQDPEHSEIRRRHLEYYVRLVNQAERKVSTREDAAALRGLDVEIENIYVALAWALENAPGAALQIVGDLVSYWAARRDRTGLTWLEMALAHAVDAPARDRARAKLGVVPQQFLRGRWDLARDAATDALLLYRAIRDDAGIAAALCELAGITAVTTGDRAKAREYAQASTRHARIAGDDVLIGRALSWLAPLLEGDERSAALDEAANLLSHAGDNRSLAQMYMNAAYEELQADRPDDAEALRLLRLALPAAERRDTVYSKMAVLGNLGLAHLFTGDLGEARAALEAHLRLCAEESFPFGPDEAMAALAAISAREGEFERAARLFGAARALGYPSAGASERIHTRLERDYLAAARRRYGADAWCRAEEAGARLSYDDAVALGAEGRDARRVAQSHDDRQADVPDVAELCLNERSPHPLPSRPERRLRAVD